MQPSVPRITYHVPKACLLGTGDEGRYNTQGLLIGSCTNVVRYVHLIFSFLGRETGEHFTRK